MRQQLAAITSLLSLAITSVYAWGSPGYDGFNLRWQETFEGAQGNLPNTGNWDIKKGDLGVNDEWETYTSSTRNLQLTGGRTLQIVPWRDGSAHRGWTSGRLESWYTFIPEDTKVTRVEASLRFGTNAQENKQGIWPAWWVLGDSIRHNVSWPRCGELDIMENINGKMTGYGTVHCQTYPGGVCNEPNGIGSPVEIGNNDFHVWRLEIDRRDGDWTRQTITWYLDGNRFHEISGSRINDYDTWINLTQKPLFFILNLAVGGSWPGPPNGATYDGYGSMMEVGYVAHYTTW